MRMLIAGLVVGVAGIVLPAGAGAEHGTEAAKQAAREIQAARDRANAAADALFAAESELDQLDVEITETASELAAVEADAAEMRAGLEEQAARRFVNSGATSIPLLTDLDDTNDALTVDVYASVSRQAGVVDLDDFDAVMLELSVLSDDLERQQSEQEAARETYAVLQSQAEAEIVRLQEIEEQRLLDEAVEHELERQRRERAEREAAAAAAAAAAAPAAGSAASGSSSGSAGSGSADGGSTGSSSGSSGSSSGSSGSSSESSSSGGSSSNGSSGSSDSSGSSNPEPAPAPAPAPVETPPPSNAGSGIVCPIQHPRAYSDTWGAPRSGGRRHKGVDMISPTGTPIIAVESGSVRFTNNRLGGNAVWLNGNSGTSYYYAHLSSFEGSGGSVSQGQIIGYNGSTGNAGVPHLHFEVHPGGGAAVNPYPYVRAVC